MVLQERDIEVLSSLATYFILSSRQIRELCFADDTTGRITRRRLTKMMHAGYVRKRSMNVVHPTDGSTSPVYHLTKQGREFLAGHFDDELLLLKPIEPSQPQHLFHYTAVAQSHWLINQAAKQHADEVTIHSWCNEDEIVNPHEPKEKHRKLRSGFSGKSKVVCLPDAAFLLDYQGHRIAIYLEEDRDTFFYDRVAARKSPGYRQLLAVQGHRSHFPETTLDFFYVLFMTPTKKRADQLRRAFTKKNKDQDVVKTYRFASHEELDANNFFFEPMLFTCKDEERVPLIKRTT